jgi:hypothetical protein
MLWHSGKIMLIGLAAEAEKVSFRVDNQRRARRIEIFEVVRITETETQHLIRVGRSNDSFWLEPLFHITVNFAEQRRPLAALLVDFFEDMESLGDFYALLDVFLWIPRMQSATVSRITLLDRVMHRCLKVENLLHRVGSDFVPKLYPKASKSPQITQFSPNNPNVNY